MMTSRLIALTTGLAFAAGAACAQSDDFTTLDADASGGLSFAEVQALDPNVAEQDFMAYDTDGSGELSAEEFAVWTSGGAEGDGYEEDTEDGGDE